MGPWLGCRVSYRDQTNKVQWDCLAELASVHISLQTFYAHQQIASGRVMSARQVKNKKRDTWAAETLSKQRRNQKRKDRLVASTEPSLTETGCCFLNSQVCMFTVNKVCVCSAPHYRHHQPPRLKHALTTAALSEQMSQKKKKTVQCKKK